MSKAVSHPSLEENACIYILSVSAAMIGVCMTVIGLIRIAVTLGKFDTIADDLLATDAFMFLFACFFSYWALRTRNKQRMHHVERAADYLFLGGLALMAVVCVLVTYAMTNPTLP